MTLRRNRKQLSQINVVPYIDVMLVLLVIFMVTAPFISPGQVELPRVSQSSNAPAEPMEVVIKDDESLLLREQVAPNVAPRPVSREALLAVIERKQRTNPEQPVVISADKNVRYEAVMQVMDVLRKNGVKKIGLLAEPTAR
jgi:biopolymer transport protein TolR